MDEQAITRINANYAVLTGQLARITAAFYERLFAAHPEVRSLFTVNMESQSRHLAAALALIVQNLRFFDALEEPLAQLGLNHARIGVRPQQYPVVCRMMVESLREASGTGWTSDLERDWTSLLGRVSVTMMNGALRATSTTPSKPNPRHS